MQRRQLVGPLLAFWLLLSLAQAPVNAAISGLETLPAAAVVVDRSDEIGTRLSIKVPEIGMTQATSRGDAADLPALSEEPTTYKPGYPELPMIVRTVLVPPGSGVRLVVHNLETRTEPNFTPFIAPPQDGSVDLEASGAPAADFLQTAGFWPPEPFVLGEPAILRGYRMVQVIFYPMQVNPTTGEVRYNDNADFELVYEGTGDNSVVKPARPRPSSNIAEIIGSLVVNPPTRDVSRDGIPGRGCYMLIYYNTQTVTNGIAPLIEWRKRQGWNVVAVGFNANTSANNIKDRIQEQYDGDNPPEMIALVGDPDWGGNGVPPWSQTTDQGYALLEGRDILADADYGRISAGTAQELDRVIAKIISYESDPSMQDTRWFNRGAVCAGEAGSGISTVFVNKWVRREALDRTWNDVAEWYWNAGQGSVPDFFRDQFRRGISFITYRGFQNMSGVNTNDIMNYQATGQYPFATTLTCNSGDYTNNIFGNTEAFFRSAGGAIGAIGFCTPQTHVPYNNIVMTGIWAGIFKYNLYNLGTACNYGRFALWQQYDGHEPERVTEFSSWANLMGDPATDYWTDVPQQISASYEQTLALGGSHLSVSVTSEADGTPITDANVCLFKADDEFQMVVKTDADGIADFTIPPTALTAGDNLLVTVTKHNVKPHLGQITVGQAEQYLGVEGWEIVGDDNGDGIANPGESFGLRMSLKNYGTTTPDGALTITAESLSDYAMVEGGAQLDQSPAANEAVPCSLSVFIRPVTPDGTVIPISIITRAGETEWLSMAAVEVASPKIAITRAHIPNNRFNPGEVINFDLTILNIGHARLEPTRATLWSESPSVRVVSSEVHYRALNPEASDSANGALFRVRSVPYAVPGSTAILMLAVETESGFMDTTSISITIGEGAVTDPFGPDRYGYVCFDSGDESWDNHPVYDWIEIDPNVQDNEFDGTLLNIRDGQEDDDHSIVVDLPFEFQYYGRGFNQLTICSNGWAAFGNWLELADFRNRRIATPEGPNAQLCPFWDDMTMGRITTFFDQDSSRFIVEWNGMRSLGGGTQTFQMILHDLRYFASSTGDGIIIFQYRDINNPNSGGGSNDTPFGTVGIGNLDDTDGLEYTYYDAYTRGAMRLQDGMAIKFTTTLSFSSGVLLGTVVDLATGMPVEGAEVTTTRGFWGNTDANGQYVIDDILVGNYDAITVRKQGYNDSTWVGFEGAGFAMAQEETLTVDLGLLHPEFNIDFQHFEYIMLNDSTTTSSLLLSNDGNGTLWFKSRFTPQEENAERTPMGDPGPVRQGDRDESDAIWNEMLSFNLTDPTGNERMQSITFVEDHWFVAGGHTVEEDPNYFYEFDREGRYNGVSYLQPVPGRFALRDMEYYNGYVYAAYSDSSWILKIDPSNGEEVQRWSTPRGFNNPRNLTVDPATGHFWIAGITTRLIEFDLTDTAMVEVRRFITADPRTNEEMHKYGLAWFRDDPDGYCIYLITNDEIGNDINHANVALFKMNPLTGHIIYLTDLPDMDPSAAARGGMTITPRWNNNHYVLAAVFEQPRPVQDFVRVLDLAPNSSWIDYNPRIDTLTAGEQRNIELTITSSDLDTGRYEVAMEFLHNAGEGFTRVPVRLDVVSTLPVDDLNEAFQTPLDYSLSPVFPNPFNSRTSIAYSLKNAGKVRLEVYDLNGRLVATLADGVQAAGSYKLAFDGEGLSAGLYIYRLRAEGFSASQKMLLLK